jgi:hypothetical protein
MAFLWGSSGEKLTQKQADERRRVAQALMSQASDTSPVGHWTAALNRGLQGYLGGRQAYLADEGAKLGKEHAKGIYQGLPGMGGNAVAAALSGASGQYTAPAEASAIRAGLIERGLPEHIADGFIMNFEDESGLNPGINEQNPIVPGSRGGFGLYQLTGPRRTAYEAFAADRGVDPADIDAQLDWLMYELQGPEAAAAQEIFAAQDAGSAGAAIVNRFLRPAEQHRTSRAAKYTGGAPASSGGNSSAILAAMSDPHVAEAYGPQLAAMLSQAQGREDAVFQQQLRQQDPAYQLGLDKAALEIEAMRNPSRPAPETNVFYDEATGRDYRAQWNPNTLTWDRIGGTKSPSGPLVSLDMGGDKFSEEVGKGQAAAFQEMSATGFSAAQNLGNLDRLESLLAQGPSGAAAALQNLAANYGIDVGNAGPLQAANALIQAMIPAQRPAGSGPMSDKDIEMFKNSLPRLINSAEGNALIIQTLRGIAQYDMQRAEIADRAMLPASDPDHLPRSEATKMLRELRSPLSDFSKSASAFKEAQEDGSGATPDISKATLDDFKNVDLTKISPQERAAWVKRVKELQGGQ